MASAARNVTPSEHGVLSVLVAFRWFAWVWLALVALVTRADFARPLAAAVLVAGALAATVAATAIERTAPSFAVRSPIIVGELSLAGLLLLGDGWTHQSREIGSASQSLASVWPLASVATAGLVQGPVAGAAAGLALGACRAYGTTLNEGFRSWEQGQVLSVTTTTVLYALVGVVAAIGAERLRRAESEVSSARALAAVAATLHDGVLQTLAVVQRRSTDPDLVALATDQERELRAFLFGAARDRKDLLTRLRAEVDRCHQRFGVKASLVVVEEPHDVEPAVSDALVGAVGEALTNAAKHGQPSAVTVFVDLVEATVSEGVGEGVGARDGAWHGSTSPVVFCSVHDDGIGFDPAAVQMGQGLAGSITDRMAEVGGRVEIDSSPGKGTEVRLWTR